MRVIRNGVADARLSGRDAMRGEKPLDAREKMNRLRVRDNESENAFIATTDALFASVLIAFTRRHPRDVLRDGAGTSLQA